MENIYINIKISTRIEVHVNKIDYQKEETETTMEMVQIDDLTLDLANKSLCGDSEVGLRVGRW